MSLILPQSQQNPTLENNLKALFQRYPHEKARLEPLLRKPQTPFELVSVELPPVPSKPPIRILLLLGIVNPQFIADLLNDKTVRAENFKLFIFENDVEFIASVFQYADLTQLIMARKFDAYITEWFIDENAESVKSSIFRALRPEAVTGMMLNVQALQTQKAKLEEFNEFYKHLPTIYDETVRHVLHNYGGIDDSILGYDVTLRNKDFVLNAPGINDLRNHYRGVSALICGAGPSLEKNLEKIKKYNDRFVVIAADAAVKPLINAGIRVDYCTSIERLNAYQKPFFENLPKTETELVAFPVVHPDVLKTFPGTVRIVYRNYSFFAYFEKAFPKGLLRCGGSTSHLGLRLASYMGCSRAYLLGLDSSYEEKNGLYRSHMSGTGHPDWGEFIPLQEFHTKRNHMPPIQVANNLGQPVMSNLTYYQWIKELSEELAFVGHTMPITNCSANGVAISGVPYKDLAEAAENLDPNFPGKPEPTVSNMTRNWNHSDLLAQLKAWHELCLDALKEAEALSKEEEIDPKRYEALLYCLQFRMITDILFIAFVIQCCATEFFMHDNEWYAFSLDLFTDLKPKVQIMIKRFNLFKEVLEKLIKVTKERA